MPKEYHQTERERAHERRGMKKYEIRSHNPGRMSSHHGRYGMDSGYMGMISEDHNAPSNLPQEVKHQYYPKPDYVDNYYLDDTIKGVDDNIDDNLRY